VNRTERARIALDRLRDDIPSPETELRYRNEYELIVAVILSAQCTDARVNMVTPDLFEAFPTLEALAAATPEQVYPLIKSVTYPNNKSKHLVGMAQTVLDAFDGQIPSGVKDLMKLPGVGRKTAQVVASVAFDVDALPVDTHVFRVANRIGLVKDATTPHAVERQLKRVIPKADWGEAHHLLILHGRYVCTARNPKCDDCPLTDACVYYERLQKLPDPLDALDPKKGRYYCKTRDHYFDDPATHVDRYDVEQIACPRCGSMNVFDARTGATTKQVKDYRVN
jgi:endonuclease-3